MSDSVIIFGSARNDGNTNLAVKYLNENITADLINLNDLNISYYDYEHSNSGDDFLPTAESILNYKNIIFASPVYWYSMSAIMKTFFDRFTDLVTIRKDLGRSFKGKRIFVLSTSGSQKNIDIFVKPFEATAEYFNMEFGGNLNLNIRGNELLKENFTQIDGFIEKIIN